MSCSGNNSALHAPYISFSSPFNSINRFVLLRCLAMGSSTEIFSNRDDVTRTRDNHLQERVVLLIEPIQLDYLCIQGNKASHQSRYFPPFQLCAIRKLFHQHEVAWTFYFNSFIIMNCCCALLRCCGFTNNGISLVCMWELTLLNIGKQLTIQ